MTGYLRGFALCATMLLLVGSLHGQANSGVCPPLDPDIFPPETCAAVLTYLATMDQVGYIAEDGSFIVLSPRSDGRVNVNTYTLPPKLRSEIALNSLRSALESVQDLAQLKPNGVFAAMLPQGREMWLKLRDLYCYYHPERTYLDFIDGDNKKCTAITDIPDAKTADNEFSGVLVFEANYLTFLNAQTAERLDAERAAQWQPVSPPAGSVHVTSPPASESKTLALTATNRCAKNISFGLAEGGHITPLVPAFTEKWVKKNRDKYPGVCFSQTPISNGDNYLLVFANSESAFIGFYPSVRTSRATSTGPVSGNGTVTDNYGGMWDFTYNGTVTTTTTTTERLNVPYTDTSNTLYIHIYNQRGILLGRRWRTLTRRSGGDPYNSLGYNLGSAFFSIHAREHLLKDAVRDLVKGR